MTGLFRQSPWFYTLYAFFLLFGGVLLLFQHDKGDFVLLVNGAHTSFLDALFSFTNKMGEGTFYFIVLAALLFIRISYSMYGILCLLQSSITVLALKWAFNSPRPATWFQGKNVLHFVEGMPINYHYSFPSGHTATAFTLFCFLALIVKDKRWGALFLLMGIFAGISRIYLAQHFLVDVYFGSMIGVIVASLNFFFIKSYNWFLGEKKLSSQMFNSKNG